MPQCFTLTRKGETKPARLIEVDGELCKVLGVEPHPQFYVAGWFDCIGFLIATRTERVLGSQELRDAVEDWFADGYNAENKPNMLKMLAYLEENYSSNGWYQVGK